MTIAQYRQDRFGLMSLAVLFGVATVICGQEPKEEGLHGEWEMVRMVYKGVVQDPARVQGGTIKIDKGKLLLRYKDWNAPVEFRVEIRPGKEPKEIDLFLSNGILTRGIYELKGGTLQIVLGQKDDPRPTSFDAEKDKSLLLYTLDRFAR